MLRPPGDREQQYQMHDKAPRGHRGRMLEIGHDLAQKQYQSTVNGHIQIVYYLKSTDSVVKDGTHYGRGHSSIMHISTPWIMMCHILTIHVEKELSSRHMQVDCKQSGMIAYSAQTQSRLRAESGLVLGPYQCRGRQAVDRPLAPGV